MIAILRVRCGSSVYVQKKSCSFISNGGGFSAGCGDFDRRVVPAAPEDREVVIVEVVATISKIKCCVVCQVKNNKVVLEINASTSGVDIKIENVPQSRLSNSRLDCM